jgi:hypothetical protein
MSPRPEPSRGKEGGRERASFEGVSQRSPRRQDFALVKVTLAPLKAIRFNMQTPGSVLMPCAQNMLIRIRWCRCKRVVSR